MLRGRLAALRPPGYSAVGVEQALATKYMSDHCVADLLRVLLKDLVLVSSVIGCAGREVLRHTRARQGFRQGVV